MIDTGVHVSEDVNTFNFFINWSCFFGLKIAMTAYVPVFATDSMNAFTVLSRASYLSLISRYILL